MLGLFQNHNGRTTEYRVLFCLLHSGRAVEERKEVRTRNTPGKEGPGRTEDRPPQEIKADRPREEREEIERDWDG